MKQYEMINEMLNNNNNAKIITMQNYNTYNNYSRLLYFQ